MGADRWVLVVQLQVERSLHVPLLLRPEDFLGHRLAPKRRDYVVSNLRGQRVRLIMGSTCRSRLPRTESS